MLNHLRPAFVFLVLFTVLTGVLYPLAVAGIAQVTFPVKANGSLITKGDQVVGSALIGQAFAGEGYFWPRPSAIDYDAAASSGSNLGPTSKALVERITGDIARLGGGAIPADAVTTSASGLDPHISPEFALLQVARVAKARGMEEPALRALISGVAEGRGLGVLGQPRVNVLLLNLQLDALVGPG